METHDKCELLAAKIRAILNRGMILDDDVIHYIDSTFSNPTVGQLESILNDDTDCERDSLMDLLFFPDESMQLQLEQVLETLQLERREEPRVLACLCKTPLDVPLRFADQRGTLRVRLPESFAARLLSRLRIGKTMDSRLLAAISNFGAQADRLKVRIRNARFAPTARRIEILHSFFEKIDPAGSDATACLDFLLDFLEEFDEHKDPCRALADKKKFYFLNLQKAARLAHQLQHTNMETFLLQGKRVMLIDAADARRKMKIIDRISRALFGKTEYFEPVPPDEDTAVRRTNVEVDFS